MNLTKKYVDKVKALIEEAKNEGIEIAPYESYIGDTVIESGIIVGTDITKIEESETIVIWRINQ